MPQLTAFVAALLIAEVACLQHVAWNGTSNESFEPGNPICPCITANHRLAAPIQVHLRELDEANTYGLQGCRDYDAGNEVKAAAKLLAASLDVDEDEQTRLMRREAKASGFCGPKEKCTLSELQTQGGDYLLHFF